MPTDPEKLNAFNILYYEKADTLNKMPWLRDLLKFEHVLGIADDEILKSEGNYNFTSLMWIHDGIDRFLKSAPDITESEKKYILELMDAMKIAAYASPQVNLLFLESRTEDITEEQALNSILSRYKNNQLAQVSTGWTGHAVGLSLINDRLIITNTGERYDDFIKTGSIIYKIKTGSIIYKIDPAKVTKEFLEKIINNKNKGDLMPLIESIIVHDEEPIYHQHSAQKVGNCSYSNPKKSMEESLACMIALERSTDGKLTNTGIKQVLSEFDQREAKDEKSLFKKLTGSFRKQALDDLKNHMAGLNEHSDPKYVSYLTQFNDLVMKKQTDKAGRREEKKKYYEFWNKKVESIAVEEQKTSSKVPSKLNDSNSNDNNDSTISSSLIKKP